MLEKLSLVFSAGALGGFMNALCYWFFGYAGISPFFGLTGKIGWDPAHVYWGVTWGGIWGVIFLLPVLKKSVVLRGLIFSLGPTLVALLVVFPLKGMGLFGFNVSLLMPSLALILNAVWGIGASIWVDAAGLFEASGKTVPAGAKT